jgi:hypothetical protein
MRTELQRLQNELGTTTTHVFDRDRGEALHNREFDRTEVARPNI